MSPSLFFQGSLSVLQPFFFFFLVHTCVLQNRKCRQRKTKNISVCLLPELLAKETLFWTATTVGHYLPFQVSLQSSPCHDLHPVLEGRMLLQGQVARGHCRVPSCWLPGHRTPALPPHRCSGLAAVPPCSLSANPSWHWGEAAHGESC